MLELMCGARSLLQLQGRRRNRGCKAGTGLHWGGVSWSLLAGKSGKKHLFGVIEGVFPVSLSGFSRSGHSPFLSALLLLAQTIHRQGNSCCGGLLEA